MKTAADVAVGLGIEAGRWLLMGKMGWDFGLLSVYFYFSILF